MVVRVLFLGLLLVLARAGGGVLFGHLPLLPATFLPAAAAAQEPETEVQIPLHPELGVEELGPELERALDLFPDIPDFEAARLFQKKNQNYVLEISYRDAGRLARNRVALDAEGLATFRDQLADRYARAELRPAFPTEGRGGLVLRQTILGLVYYGWAVPVALGIDDARAAVGTYLLTSGASFFLPYSLTRARPVGDAHRDFTLWASSRGIPLGIALGDLITGERNGTGRVALGSGVVTSAAGAFGGYQAVRRSGADEAEVALWGAMGDAGTLLGFGSAYALGLYRRDEPTYETPTPDGETVEGPGERSNRRLGHALGLAGAAAGLGTGRWLAEREDHSEGNVGVLQSMGILGAHLALPVANAAGARGGRAHVGAGLVGGVAGLAAGNRILRPEAFTGGDALLVAAGQIGGGAAGLGIAYLVSPDPSENELLYLSSTAAGSLAGFGLVYRALSRRWGGESPGALRRRPGAGSGALAGPTVAVDPAAALLPGRSPVVSLRF